MNRSDISSAWACAQALPSTESAICWANPVNPIGILLNGIRGFLSCKERPDLIHEFCGVFLKGFPVPNPLSHFPNAL